jgi:predicted dienelactone hydrolase
MDPLAVMFDAAGLASVRIPTLLYRPDDDAYLNAQHNALAVAAGLPNPSQQVVVPGSHFVFVDPCPDAIADQAPLICKDATGVDRASVHRKMESEISAFLHAHL